MSAHASPQQQERLSRKPQPVPTSTSGPQPEAAAAIRANSESPDANEAAALQRLRSVMIDTRASQNLEPIRLPHKLRERIDKAQRRAAAAKDGVSIFTQSTDQQQRESSLLFATPSQTPKAQPGTSALGPANAAKPGGATSKATGPGRTSSMLAADTSSARQLLHEKIHLPEVVLSHKMRDFEAKTNANSLLADPLDNSLNRLTIEEKERVMQRMQEKIQQITRDIDDNFLKLKDELDANGIFDSTANYQRAQAICLVELQKRCRLERLRDEAIKEVVDGETGDSSASDSRRRRISAKLSLLLTQSNQLGHESAGEATRTNPAASGGDGNREIASISHRATPNGGKRLPQKAMLMKKSGQHLPKLPVERSNQQGLEGESSVANAINSSSSEERHKTPLITKRDHTGRNASEKTNKSSHRGASTRDDVNGTGGGGGIAIAGGDRGDEALVRHPHIAHVLQQMASGAFVLSSSTSSSRSTHNGNSGGGGSSLADVEDSTRPKSAIEQWSERSKSYQTIAARAAEALHKRTERIRWDSLGHFTVLTTTSASAGAKLSISETLHRKLLLSCRSVHMDKRLAEADKAGRKSARETAADRSENRKRASDQQYASVQEQIRSRLQREKKKKMVGSSAKVSHSKQATGGSTPLGTRAQVMAIAPNPSHRNINSPAEHLQPQESQQAPPEHQASRKSISPLLGSSVSAPSLATESARPVMEATGSVAANPAPAQLGSSYSVSDLRGDGNGDPAPTVTNRASLVRGSRDVARISLIERKLGSSQRHSRRFRKESLIGAPVLTDFSTIGHHSNARMEERRYSAQTWAWHHSSLLSHHKGSESFDEEQDGEEDEEDEDDTFGGAIDEEDDEDASEAPFNDSDRSSRDLDLDMDDGASSVAHSSFYELDTARSSRSIVTLVHAVSSAAARKKKIKGKRSGGKLHHHQGSSSNLLHHYTAGQSVSSIALQSRLEEIWKALEFPFSHKLLMLEKYADLQDADTFQSALTSWEKVAEVVLLRERLKFALGEFEEHQEIKAVSRLSGSEWMFLRSLHIETPSEGVYRSMSSEALVEWIREHMDVVTSRCHKFAQELKAATGDELQFQGYAYPPRM